MVILSANCLSGGAGVGVMMSCVAGIDRVGFDPVCCMRRGRATDWTLAAAPVSEESA